MQTALDIVEKIKSTLDITIPEIVVHLEEKDLLETLEEVRNLKVLLEIYFAYKNSGKTSETAIQAIREKILEMAMYCHKDVVDASMAKEVVRALSSVGADTTYFLTKWEELSLRDAKNATTLEKAYSAYVHSPTKSSAKRIAREKCEKISIALLEEATTSESLQNIYRKIPGFLKKLKETVMNKWLAQALKEAENAKTPNEALDALRAAPDNSQPQKIATSILCTTMLSALEVRDTLEYVRKDLVEIRQMLLDRWSLLSTNEAQAANSKEEAFNAFCDAPKNTPSEKLALEKWLSFCETVDDFEEVLPKTSEYPELQIEALSKICELTKDTKKLESLFCTTDKKHRDIVLKRWCSLITTTREIQFILTKCVPLTAEEMEIVTKRWNELSLSAVHASTSIGSIRAAYYSDQHADNETKKVAIKKLFELIKQEQ
ncbi:hypothetical protein ISS03_00860 [Patescibacteria group bacterium]|nr:hypothetical protein [Patescibacteria group bacterium]